MGVDKMKKQTLKARVNKGPVWQSVTAAAGGVSPLFVLTAKQDKVEVLQRQLVQDGDQVLLQRRQLHVDRLQGVLHRFVKGDPGHQFSKKKKMKKRTLDVREIGGDY